MSNRGLVAVPEKVWIINELDGEEQKNVTKGLSMDRVRKSYFERFELLNYLNFFLGG